MINKFTKHLFYRRKPSQSKWIRLWSKPFLLKWIFRLSYFSKRWGHIWMIHKNLRYYNKLYSVLDKFHRWLRKKRKISKFWQKKNCFMLLKFKPISKLKVLKRFCRLQILGYPNKKKILKWQQCRLKTKTYFSKKQEWKPKISIIKWWKQN